MYFDASDKKAKHRDKIFLAQLGVSGMYHTRTKVRLADLLWNLQSLAGTVSFPSLTLMVFDV
jgi:hypothetical protein